MFLDLANCIYISDWMRLEVSVKSPHSEKKYDITSLKFRDEIFKSTSFSALHGLIDLSLHGLGCGGVRHTEVCRLRADSVSWHRGCCYFFSESIKGSKKKTTTKAKMVEHKLSPSISRVLLLFR